LCEVQTEVFGLGATLYEIRAGRAPHAWSDGLRPADWTRHVRDARFVRPRRWNPSAPKLLETICLKALARDPKRRHPSAADLATDIRQFVRLRHLTGATRFFGRFWQRLRVDVRRLAADSNNKQ
jgi:hypothetical protein